MTLQELEAQAARAKAAEVVDPEFEGDDDDIKVLVDLHDGMVLLDQTMRLLGYIGDANLCRALSKKERDAIGRLGGRIKSYLDEVQGQYGEGGE